MASNNFRKLAQQIHNLVAERENCLSRVAEIEAIFTSSGVTISGAEISVGKPAPKVGKSAREGRTRGKRGRGSYSQTADEFVLGLVKGKALVTAQINDAWQKAGRKGKADNTLTKLFATKQLKKEKVKDGRGSKYSLA